MRSFIKFLVESPTLAARLFIPALGLLSFVLWISSINILWLPRDGSALYVAPQRPPEALVLADGAAFETLREAVGEQPSIWLKSQIEQRLMAVAQDQMPEPLLSDGRDAARSRRIAANPDYQRWVADYFCTARGWAGDEDRIRRLVWEGVGPCTWMQSMTAGIPAMRWFGFGWGLLFIVAATIVTFVLLWIAFALDRVRQAYHWLYRSRVF